MPIETLEDWNQILGQCCCEMPVCPVPEKECQSVFTSAVTSGLNTQYDEGTNTVTAYSGKKDLQTTWSVDCSLNCTGYGSIPTYACNTDNGSFEDARTTTFEPLFNAGNACWSQSVAATTTCTATGSQTSNSYAIVGSEPTEGNPNPACPTQTYLSVSTTRTRSIVPPNTETEEYLAWKAIYPTQQDYDDAVAAYQQYLADYDQWVLDWDAWDAGGQVGPEPQQPEEVFEPDPPPTQYYPPCTTVDEWTTTEYPNPCNGGENTVTTGKEYNTDLANYSSFPGCTPTLAYPDDEWTGPVDQATLLTQMDTTLRAHMDFDEDCIGSDCVSAKEVVLPNNVVRTVYVSLKNVRFRWIIPVVGTIDDPDYVPPVPNDPPEPVPQIPQRWQGTHFKITWDILEEPEGWDSGLLGAPARSLILQDQTWEWTGPVTDPNDPDDAGWRSPWYEIAPPTVPGVRKIVNIRFECYRSAKFGNKPQVTGEAVEL